MYISNYLVQNYESNAEVGHDRFMQPRIFSSMNT